MRTLRSAVACAASVAVLAASTADAASKTAPPSQAEIDAYLANKPVQSRPLFGRVLIEGERNAVLNLQRAGLAAMQLGDDVAAAEALDAALLRIEKVYADNPAAKKARSKFVKESAKDFKGEPYERAMAYYYRGLIYLRAGDYENARASFRGGLLQDQLAENEKYKEDFASLELLSGWASSCLGDTAEADEEFARAKALKPSIVIPQSQDRVLLIAEYGGAPLKWSDGKYKENLRYKPGDAAVASATFNVAGASLAATPVEDLYWQASTRGGRKVDGILAGKAAFKENTAEMAEAGAIAGQTLAMSAQSAMMQANNATAAGMTPDYSTANAMAYASLAASAFSLFSAAASSAAKPQADTRYWDNLPGEIAFATAPMKADLIEVNYLDASGARVGGGAVPIVANAGKSCSIGWVRSSPVDATPEIAPNSDLKKG